METPMQNNIENNKLNRPSEADSWAEYSTLHDSFSELLSYERNRRTNSDFWQLNYV